LICHCSEKNRDLNQQYIHTALNQPYDEIVSDEVNLKAGALPFKKYMFQDTIMRTIELAEVTG